MIVSHDRSDELVNEPVDCHAHYVAPAAIAEIARVAPDLAPSLVRGEGDWTLMLPAGFSNAAPDGDAKVVPTGLIDVETRLKAMDEQGVSVQVLRNYTPLEFNALPASLAADFHRIHNDAVIDTVRSAPARFLALPCLPLQAPELAAAEVRRVAAHPEVGGIGFGTNVMGVDLDDDRFEPIWDAVEAVGLPILLHPPGRVAGADRMRDFHLGNLIGNPTESTVALGRIIFSGLLDRHPGLRFGFVHGGGFTPYQLGRWDHGWMVRDELQARIQRPPSDYVLAHCAFDALTHDPIALGFLGERVGWSRVMLGTDYPWDMGTRDPLGDLGRAGLTGIELAAVASASARKFLRWPSTSALSSATNRDDEA